MSNPTYNSANLTREAGAVLEQYRLVKLVDGKVVYATASDFPFGAVTEQAAPKAKSEPNDLSHGLPHVVNVHAGQTVVKLTTADTGFTDGAVVYAAADGKVAKTGTVKVGIADRPEESGKVRVHLFHPSIFAAS
ncbi:hypothetical protein ACMXZU_04605 [Corynebacterium striatum]